MYQKSRFLRPRMVQNCLRLGKLATVGWRRRGIPFFRDLIPVYALHAPILDTDQWHAAGHVCLSIASSMHAMDKSVRQNAAGISWC